MELPPRIKPLVALARFFVATKRLVSALTFHLRKERSQIRRSKKSISIGRISVNRNRAGISPTTQRVLGDPKNTGRFRELHMLVRLRHGPHARERDRNWRKAYHTPLFQ